MDKKGIIVYFYLYLVFIFNGLVTGCSSLPSEEAPTRMDLAKHEKYESEQALIDKWESQLEGEEWRTVQAEIQTYLKKYPETDHWFAIYFLLGKVNEKKEEWSSAIEAYQAIISRSSDRQMDIVAMALYRLSYCYEAQNKNENTLATLIDAQRHKNYLPLEISTAEIPARIATVYARLNQIDWADRYTKIAEKGIFKLKALRKRNNQEWINRTLYAMGTLNLSEINSENFPPLIRALKRNQKYLLQVVELHRPPWNKKAEQALISSYKKLWNFIDAYELPPSEDGEFDVVSLARVKSEFLTHYLESLQILKGYQAPVESPLFARSADLFLNIKDLENEAVAKLDEEMLKRPPQERDLRSTASVSESSAKPMTSKEWRAWEEEVKRNEVFTLPLPRKLPKKQLK